MDWSSTIYAGIGGALGGLLASLICQKISNKSWKSIIVVVSVIFLSRGTNTLYKNGTFPRIIPLDTTELIKELPVLEAIRNINKPEYDNLIALLDVPIRQARKNGKNTEVFRSAYFELILKYRSNTNTDVLRDFNIITADQTATYKDKQPEICTLQLHGRPFGDVSQILSQRQAFQEQAVLVRMFDSNNALPAGTIAPNAARGEKLYNDIILAEVKALNLKNADPEPIKSGGTLDAHKAICDLTIRYTLKLNHLNDSDLHDVSAYQYSTIN